MQAVWSNVNFAAFGVESAAEHHLAGVLGDLQKAARANQVAVDMGDVDVAALIHLAHAEEGDVDPAAAVEFKLIQRRENGVGVARTTK